MAKSEHQELVEFIAVRFDRNDKRFDTIDERLRRVEILGEDNRHQIQIVSVGVAGVAERVSEVAGGLSEVAERVSGNVLKLEAFRSEVAAEFQDIRELIGTSYLELDGRVTRLEEDRRR